MYTVEVYKTDRRTRAGERLVLKKDHDYNLQSLEHTYRTSYPARDGYRVEFHETYVTRKNMMNGQEFQERYDTPYFCSPSSETYWSM